VIGSPVGAVSGVPAVSFARGFWPTFVVQFSGALNDNLFKNVVVLTLAFDPSMTGATANQFVIAAGALFILPFALFSLPGGRLADRMDKAVLVRRLKGLEILLMVGGSAALAEGNVWGMLFVTFAMGTQSALFGPTKYAILPQHLDPSVLPRVNGFFQISTFAAILAGTVVAGLVSAMDEVRDAVAGSLVVGVALVGFAAAVAIPSAPPASVDDGQTGTADASVRETIRHAGLVPVMLAIAWLWFAAITVMGLVPGLTRDALGGGELEVTGLLVALTVGVAVGCLVFVVSRHAATARATVSAGAALMVVGLAGLAALVFGAAPPFAAVVAVAVIIGAAAGIYIVPLITRLQRGAGLRVRARVLAISNLTNAIFMIVASALSLGAVATLDYWAIFAVLTTGSAIVFALLVPRVVLDSTRARDTMA